MLPATRLRRERFPAPTLPEDIRPWIETVRGVFICSLLVLLLLFFCFVVILLFCDFVSALMDPRRKLLDDEQLENGSPALRRKAKEDMKAVIA